MTNGKESTSLNEVEKILENLPKTALF